MSLGILEETIKPVLQDQDKYEEPNKEEKVDLDKELFEKYEQYVNPDTVDQEAVKKRVFFCNL